MHSIQALIASENVMSAAVRLVPALTPCPLPQGLVLTPVTEDVELALSAAGFTSPTSASAVAEIAPKVQAFAARLSEHGPVVYVGTDFFGGIGSQDAMVWTDGTLTLIIQQDEDNPSAWPDSPISRALRSIGVNAEDGQDEFDAIGLGTHRSNDAWVEAFT
jgi:hypothetical protein